MRIKAGESVELIDGKGTLATARVKTPGKETSLLEISTSIQATPSKELILAQALPRPNLLDWILEKGTELGATQFWLFPGELSEKKELSAHQLQRLTTLTIAAMKQSGRLFLPQIHLKPALAKWPSLPGQVFYGDTRSSAPKLTCNPQDPITFFIGPEKGFSSKEIDHLEQTLKAKGVKLHDNILRTETAGLVALSQISLAKCAKVDSSLT
jgi:16S rRNA (uracil1498-N3)-methyltransferase